MAGDLASAGFILKLINRRCAILGFDRVADDLSGTARTLVIGGDTQQYVAGLKALVGDA